MDGRSQQKKIVVEDGLHSRMYPRLPHQTRPNVNHTEQKDWRGGCDKNWNFGIFDSLDTARSIPCSTALSSVGSLRSPHKEEGGGAEDGAKQARELRAC